MYCVLCADVGHKVLYRCIDCYQDGEPDVLMCKECRDEHDDSNYGNVTEWEEFVECKECGNVLFKETGAPFIPFIPDDDRDN